VGLVPDDVKRHTAQPALHPRPSPPKGEKEPLENYRLVSLIPAPGEITEQILTKLLPVVRDKKPMAKRQHRFTRDKLHPTNPTALYSETARVRGEQ